MGGAALAGGGDHGKAGASRILRQLDRVARALRGPKLGVRAPRLANPLQPASAAILPGGRIEDHAQIRSRHHVGPEPCGIAVVPYCSGHTEGMSRAASPGLRRLAGARQTRAADLARRGQSRPRLVPARHPHRPHRHARSAGDRRPRPVRRQRDAVDRVRPGHAENLPRRHQASTPSATPTMPTASARRSLLRHRRPVRTSNMSCRAASSARSSRCRRSSPPPE